MATIKDVARVAGVSISTVSYALSGRRPISEETRLKIAAAARSLNYEPNAGARMLASTRTHILALTAPQPSGADDHSHVVFIDAVASAARDRDLDVLLLTRDEAVSGLRRVARTSLVDGIILMDVAARDRRVPVVRELRFPATWIGIPDDPESLTCVDFDFAGAARLAVDHLAGLGHTSIGLVGFPQSVYDREANYVRRFRDAFLSSARDHNVTTSFAACEPDPRSVSQALDHLVAEAPTMSGLVLHCGDPVVRLVTSILLARGIAIPGAMSIVSVGTSLAPALAPLTLTNIPWPAETVSRRAVELTCSQILGEASGPLIELIEPHLEIGTTSGAAAS